MELASVALNGNANRYLQADISKIDGSGFVQWSFDTWSIFPTNDGFIHPYFSVADTGAMTVIGAAAGFTLENSNAAFGQFSVETTNDGSTNIKNNTTGGNPVFTFVNSFNMSAWNPAVGAINLSLPNVSGIEGFVVNGNVVGSASAFLAQVTASGPLIGDVQNLGTGDAAWVAVTNGGGNAYSVYNAVGANAYSAGVFHADSTYRIVLGAGLVNPNIIVLTVNQQVGLGGEAAPTALVHIAPSPGTPGTGPLKLTAAPLLAVPEDGLIEYDGTNFFKTIGAVRSVIV